MIEKSLNNEKFINIEENLKVIKENISNAAISSGRKPEDVTFMAVTKTVDPVYINHAINNGINLIGENKVQELLSKKDDLKLDNCDVHLIGHLQSNKVKQIINHVSMIQSVDSVKIAKEISKQAVKNNLDMKILLEINIGNEDSKTGFKYDEVLESCYEISQLPNVIVNGLMCIPPFSANKSETFKFFTNMSNLFIDMRDKKIDNIDMNVLSMGMSGDYEEAIKSGSNLVRVGSSIFGARIYN